MIKMTYTGKNHQVMSSLLLTEFPFAHHNGGSPFRFCPLVVDPLAGEQICLSWKRHRRGL